MSFLIVGMCCHSQLVHGTVHRYMCTQRFCHQGEGGEEKAAEGFSCLVKIRE
uniref:Uncharacterized protein n=1 Tax=Arundo donax TaxID=35708 RepID=A0A0A9G317_ARUDO